MDDTTSEQTREADARSLADGYIAAVRLVLQNVGETEPEVARIAQDVRAELAWIAAASMPGHLQLMGSPEHFVEEALRLRRT